MKLLVSSLLFCFVFYWNRFEQPTILHVCFHQRMEIKYGILILWELPWPHFSANATETITLTTTFVTHNVHKTNRLHLCFASRLFTLPFSIAFHPNIVAGIQSKSNKIHTHKNMEHYGLFALIIFVQFLLFFIIVELIQKIGWCCFCSTNHHYNVVIYNWFFRNKKINKNKQFSQFKLLFRNAL